METSSTIDPYLQKRRLIEVLVSMCTTPRLGPVDDHQPCGEIDAHRESGRGAKSSHFAVLESLLDQASIVDLQSGMVVGDSIHQDSLKLGNSGLRRQSSSFRVATPDVVRASKKVGEVLGTSFAVAKNDRRPSIREPNDNLWDIAIHILPKVPLTLAALADSSLSNHVSRQRNRSIRVIEDVCLVRIKERGNFGDVWERSRHRNESQEGVDCVW